MTEFFIDITQPILSAKIFPMLAFIITGILAFAIANAWGVCTLVAPVLLPLGASVGANAILIMAEFFQVVHLVITPASTVTQQFLLHRVQVLITLTTRYHSFHMYL